MKLDCGGYSNSDFNFLWLIGCEIVIGIIQIKSIRLPKRIGHHSGFAFVEFGTKQEANNAVQALSSTHLYGRHLVRSILPAPSVCSSSHI